MEKNNDMSEHNNATGAAPDSDQEENTVRTSSKQVSGDKSDLSFDQKNDINTMTSTRHVFSKDNPVQQNKSHEDLVMNCGTSNAFNDVPVDCPTTISKIPAQPEKKTAVHLTKTYQIETSVRPNLNALTSIEDVKPTKETRHKTIEEPTLGNTSQAQKKYTPVFPTESSNGHAMKMSNTTVEDLESRDNFLVNQAQEEFVTSVASTQRQLSLDLNVGPLNDEDAVHTTEYSNDHAMINHTKVEELEARDNSFLVNKSQEEFVTSATNTRRQLSVDFNVGPLSDENAVQTDETEIAFLNRPETTPKELVESAGSEMIVAEVEPEDIAHTTTRTTAQPAPRQNAPGNGKGIRFRMVCVSQLLFALMCLAYEFVRKKISDVGVNESYEEVVVEEEETVANCAQPFRNIHDELPDYHYPTQCSDAEYDDDDDEERLFNNDGVFLRNSHVTAWLNILTRVRRNVSINLPSSQTRLILSYLSMLRVVLNGRQTGTMIERLPTSLVLSYLSLLRQLLQRRTTVAERFPVVLVLSYLSLLKLLLQRRPNGPVVERQTAEANTGETTTETDDSCSGPVQHDHCPPD